MGLSVGVGRCHLRSWGQTGGPEGSLGPWYHVRACAKALGQDRTRTGAAGQGRAVGCRGTLCLLGCV